MVKFYSHLTVGMTNSSIILSQSVQTLKVLLQNKELRLLMKKKREECSTIILLIWLKNSEKLFEKTLLKPTHAS